MTEPLGSGRNVALCIFFPGGNVTLISSATPFQLEALCCISSLLKPRESESIPAMNQATNLYTQVHINAAELE